MEMNAAAGLLVGFFMSFSGSICFLLYALSSEDHKSQNFSATNDFNLNMLSLFFVTRELCLC
ncbi:hypothetical protein V2J09_009933 [Rumex salicifolius]